MAGAAAATAVASGASSAFAATGKMKHAAMSIPKSDADILNFALTLEHLEARFYTDVVARFGSVTSYFHRLMMEIKSDEEYHVTALTGVLKSAGYTPVAAQMKYHFGNVFGSRHEVLTFSGSLESTGVHAYLGQAGKLKTPELLITAAGILSVEARHTGAVHAATATKITEGPIDKGYTKAQIVKIVSPILG